MNKKCSKYNRNSISKMKSGGVLGGLGSQILGITDSINTISANKRQIDLDRTYQDKQMAAQAAQLEATNAFNSSSLEMNKAQLEAQNMFNASNLQLQRDQMESQKQQIADQLKREQDQQQQQVIDQQQQQFGESNDALTTRIQGKIKQYGAVMANGGTIKYSGQTHDGPDEGIATDGDGNPVSLSKGKAVVLTENGEVGYLNPNGERYVYSKKLGFAPKANKIINKYSGRLSAAYGGKLNKSDVLAEEQLHNEMNDLFNKQESLKSGMDSHMENIQFDNGGKIHINPENKGKFTSWAKSHGMGVQEAARHVMAHKDKYNSTIVKRANFAKNAALFHHEYGGEIMATGGTLNGDISNEAQQNVESIRDPQNKQVKLRPTYTINGEKYRLLDYNQRVHKGNKLIKQIGVDDNNNPLFFVKESDSSKFNNDEFRGATLLEHNGKNTIHNAATWLDDKYSYEDGGKLPKAFLGAALAIGAGASLVGGALNTIGQNNMLKAQGNAYRRNQEFQKEQKQKYEKAFINPDGTLKYAFNPGADINYTDTNVFQNYTPSEINVIDKDKAAQNVKFSRITPEQINLQKQRLQNERDTQLGRNQSFNELRKSGLNAAQQQQLSGDVISRGTEDLSRRQLESQMQEQTTNAQYAQQAKLQNSEIQQAEANFNRGISTDRDRMLLQQAGMNKQFEQSYLQNKLGEQQSNFGNRMNTASFNLNKNMQANQWNYGLQNDVTDREYGFDSSVLENRNNELATNAQRRANWWNFAGSLLGGAGKVVQGIAGQRTQNAYNQASLDVASGNPMGRMSEGFFGSNYTQYSNPAAGGSAGPLPSLPIPALEGLLGGGGSSAMMPLKNGGKIKKYKTR